MGLSKTGVVAGLLTAVLLGDVAGALHVSSRQRAEAEAVAAADRAAANAAWVADLRRVAESLLVARAPIDNAADFAGVDLGPAVRYDVYVRGAAAADFAGVRDALAVVPVPESRQRAHGRISSALEDMTAAVEDLSDEQDKDVEDELLAFDDAAVDWDRLIRVHVATDLPVASTTRTDVPLSAAGRLFRWSSACARARQADRNLDDPGEDPLRAATVFEGYARNLDDVLTELLAVPDGPDPTAVDRELEPALRGLREGVGGLQSFGAALRQRDAAGLDDAAGRLDRLAPLYDSAARAFEVRGSSVCSGYFNPGLLGGPEPGDPQTKDDVTAT